MYIYNIPYNYDNTIYTETIKTEKKISLEELLRKFLENIQHGYLDETFEDYCLSTLLNTCVKEYNLNFINIIYLNNHKHKIINFSIRDLRRQMTHFEINKKYIQDTNEIILSTQILYEKEIEQDFIHILNDGVETFLFTFFTKESEDIHIPFEEEPFPIFKNDFSKIINDAIKINKPLSSKQQIIKVFRQWCEQINIQTNDKQIKLASEEDFKRRPFFEKLEDSFKQDPERKFVTPSELIFFDKKSIPPIEELVEKLKKETPETIACVIDDFKDETILTILNLLDIETKKQVIKVLPCIPCQSLKEKKRFLKLFNYDNSFVKKRIETIKNKYNGKIDNLLEKETKKDSEQDDINEYLAWKNYLEKK